MAAKKKAAEKPVEASSEQGDVVDLKRLSREQLQNRDAMLAQQGVHHFSAERRAVHRELKERGADLAIQEEKGSAVSREEFYAQIMYAIAQAGDSGDFTDRNITEVVELAGNARWAYLMLLGAVDEAEEERARTRSLRDEFYERESSRPSGGYGPRAPRRKVHAPSAPTPTPAGNTIDESFAEAATD